MGHPGAHLGTMWEHLGCIRGHAGVQGELREGHVLQTLFFNLFLGHIKRPQDEPVNFDEGPRRAQGGYEELQGRPKESPGRVLGRARCSRPFVLSYF